MRQCGSPGKRHHNYALGSVALHGRDPEQAVSILKSTSRVNRKIRAVGSRVAWPAYLADYEAAAKDLRAVADKPETAPGAHYLLGRIAKLQDNLPEAETQLKQAIAADPRFADALAELGLLHVRLRQYDDARGELDRAYAIEPDNFRVNANLLILIKRPEIPAHLSSRRGSTRLRRNEPKTSNCSGEPLRYGHTEELANRQRQPDAPSFDNLMYRSMGKLVKVSNLSLGRGQRISKRSTALCLPMPRTSRGSWEQDSSPPDLRRVRFKSCACQVIRAPIHPDWPVCQSGARRANDFRAPRYF